MMIKNIVFDFSGVLYDFDYIEGSWDIVKRLREREYRTALLSNMDEFTARSFSDKLDENFDSLFISSRIGYVKPQKEIFEYLLERMNAEPYECLFIDDDEVNVEAARGLGIEAIHFKSAEQLRWALEQRGIEI